MITVETKVYEYTNYIYIYIDKRNITNKIRQLTCVNIYWPMVDVDRRMASLNLAHIASLHYLSTRAAAALSIQVHNNIISFASLASKVINHLCDLGIHV